jgi:uncharacterized protein YbjQ (UPF0145 family)
MIMTTEAQNGFEVAERLAIVSAQCALGQKVFNDAFASVQDVVDRRSESVEKAMQDSVDVVLAELKKQALALHADAVIAVTIQYTPIGYGASNRTLVSGIGTAVRFEI